MPLKDFSRGYPRSGQWVLIDKALLGIFTPQGRTPRINRKDGVMTVLPPLVVAKDLPTDESKDWVDLVGEDGEYTGTMQVKLSRLTPLLDRTMIPAKRLSKMDPNWVPTP